MHCTSKAEVRSAHGTCKRCEPGPQVHCHFGHHNLRACSLGLGHVVFTPVGPPFAAWAIRIQQGCTDSVKKQVSQRGTGTVQELARQVLGLARAGLQNRGKGEEKFLQPLEHFAETGMTGADVLLEKFHNEWHGSVDPCYAAENTY